MTHLEELAASRALWNRWEFDLASDEALAQVLDRGSMEDWRALYALARNEQPLRRRIVRVVARAPMYLPHFWLVAMEGLGEAVDLAAVAPSDGMQE
jgi:hypothetical protein